MMDQQLINTLQRHDERMRALEVKQGQQEVINQNEGADVASLVEEMGNLREDFTAFGLVLTEIKVTVNGARPNGRRGQLYEKAKVSVEAGIVLALLGLLIERLVG